MKKRSHNKILGRFGFLVFLISLISIFSCSSELQNLSLSKKEVDSYYTSGRYGLELYDIIQNAIDNISSLSIKTNSAVIFDVDETVLSNYEYIKAHDFGWNKESWDRWLLQAKAKSIPHTLKLYEFLIDNNISVIFITARPQKAYEATIKNLQKAGYATFDTLICKTGFYEGMSSKEFKTAERIKLVNNGYDIIASVGDQDSDLEGDYTGIRIKIPNYFYKL